MKYTELGKYNFDLISIFKAIIIQLYVSDSVYIFSI